MLSLHSKRLFTKEQRYYLFDRCGGICEKCSQPLGDDWEADHITRYSDGGLTAVRNAQALCKPCHQLKTKLENQLDYALRPTLTGKTPRKWQAEALHKIEELRLGQADRKHFAVNATPGAGKSLFMQLAVRHYLHLGLIDSVLIVVPTDSLRGDMAKNFLQETGLRLVSTAGPLQVRDVKDAIGQVVTYQQLSNPENLDISLDYWSRDNKKVLLIADEIHHGADHAGSSWGKCLQIAMEHSEYALLLTGTMWRSDQSKIPGIKYISVGDQTLIAKPDYDLNLETATNDGYVTTVWFDRHNIEVRFKPGEEEAETFDTYSSVDGVVQQALRDAEGKAADVLLRMVVNNPMQEGVRLLLADAHKSLMQLKRHHKEVYGTATDAPAYPAGLVVAATKKNAEQIARVLNEITGERATIVHGSVDKCRERINSFRASKKDWIVSVGMISEGVDIPRVKVIAYLTNKRTRLIFSQIVGRAMRVRFDATGAPVMEQAKVHIPAHFELDQFAEEFLEAQNATAEEGLLFPSEKQTREPSVYKTLQDILDEIAAEEAAIAAMDPEDVVSTKLLGKDTVVNGENVAPDLFYHMAMSVGISRQHAEVLHRKASQLGLLNPCPSPNPT